MLDGIARQVCALLFNGLRPPNLVLGQKACGRILVALKFDLIYRDISKKKIFLKTILMFVASIVEILLFMLKTIGI